MPKFKPVAGRSPLSLPELEADYAAARDLGQVRLGALCLYYPRLTAVSYLPLAQVERVYLRQEEVNARMCCAVASLDQFFLMAVPRDGEAVKGHLLNREVGKWAMERLAESHPQILQGRPPRP